MLDKISLFADLSPEELGEVKKILKKGEFRRGDIIFREGDLSRDLFVLISGTVEITVRDLSMTPKLVSTFRAGDFFGEMSIIDPTTPRSSTAKAVQNCQVLVVPYEEYEKLMHGEQPLSRSLKDKIMRALSARMREATKKAVNFLTPAPTPNGKVLVIASPRGGAGRTTLATVLASILSKESNRKVLVIDLDVFFGDSTFLFGVYSDQSVTRLAHEANPGPISQERFFGGLTRPEENLYVAPAAKNILAAEAPTSADLSALVRLAREHFDYIVIDSEAGISEVIVTAIEVSDHTFFLIDRADFLNIKNSVRYFHALSRFDFPESKISIFLTKVGNDVKPESLPKLQKYHVAGVLPDVQVLMGEYGKTLYHLAPGHPYCSFVRQIVTGVLKERVHRDQGDKKLLSRLFTAPPPEAPAVGLLRTSSSETSLDTPPLEITEANLGVLLRDVRRRFLDGFKEEALAKVRQLLFFCPDSAGLFQVMGEILAHDGNVSEAVIVLKIALSIDPENHIALGTLGHITSDRPVMERALALIRGKLGGSERFPDMANDLGRICLQLGDAKGAIQAFRNALAQNPHYREARINLGIALGENRQFEEAVRELSVIDQKSVRVWYLIGCYHHVAGRFPEAFQAFQRAAEIKPDYADLMSRMEKIRSYLQRIETLIEMHRENLSVNEAYPDLHFNLANLYLLIGKKDEAMLELMEAVKLKPNYHEAKQRLTSLEREMKAATA